MKKVPTIVLSVSYKGVKFIDATNKVILTVPVSAPLNNSWNVQAFEKVSEMSSLTVLRSVVTAFETLIWNLFGVKINRWKKRVKHKQAVISMEQMSWEKNNNNLLISLNP